MRHGARLLRRGSQIPSVKARWVRFSSCKDRHEWDQLRSQPSCPRNNGVETVRYGISMDDTEVPGAHLSLKHRFWPGTASFGGPGRGAALRHLSAAPSRRRSADRVRHSVGPGIERGIMRRDSASR